MGEKGIRGGICQAIHRYAKENNNFAENCNKNVESSYLMYLGASNLYGWAMAMSQKLRVNCFKWIQNLSKLNESFIKVYDENFIKVYDENSDMGYFLEVDVEYPKKVFS